MPFAAAYALYFNGRMNGALRRPARIGAINERVEDSLSGIRVVKSFANEGIEARRFAEENARFLQTRRFGYLSEAWASAGLATFAQLITVTVIVIGAARITAALAQRRRPDDLPALRRDPGRPDQAHGQFRAALAGGPDRLRPLHGHAGDRPGDPRSPWRPGAGRRPRGDHPSARLVQLSAELPARAARSLARHRRRRVRGPDRLFRGRQDHALLADPPLLRGDRRRGADRRRRRQGPHAGLAAPQHRGGAAGRLPVRRLGGRQPRLRAAGRQPGRDRRGRPQGSRARLHRRPARGLRHRRRPARGQALRRPEAAADHRPGVPQGPADPDLRRGHQRARLRERTGGAGGAARPGRATARPW